jgi:thiol-disulfide isomerase/thioredoxin
MPVSLMKIIVTVFFILFSTPWLLAQNGSGFSSNNEKKVGMMQQASNGEFLLPFRMINLDADDIDFTEFYGKTVVINVWSTWSKPAANLIHSFDSISKTLANDSLVFIKISVDHNLDDWFTYSDTLPLSNNHYWVGDSYRNSIMWFTLESVELSQTENIIVSNLPKFVIIRPDGSIKNNNASAPNLPDFVVEVLE